MITPVTLPEWSSRVLVPGFYRMPAWKYHADCCPEPSLSSTIAKTLLDKSPRHAWTDHPRLCPDFEPDDEKKFDFGSVMHELLLGQGAGTMEVEADSWRSNAAKAARAAIIEQGGQPILSKDIPRATAMRMACRDQLEAAGLGHVFADSNRSEVVMVWQDEGGIWCRAMIDWHVFEGVGLTVYDLKTSGTAVRPDALGWKVVDQGYEVQAAFYERGLAVLLPEMLGRVTWRWVFQEDKPPFSISVGELDGAGKTIGAKKSAAAISIWRHCIETGSWPRWPTGIHSITYPMRAEADWIEREMSDPQLQALTINPLVPVQESRGGLDMLPELAP